MMRLQWLVSSRYTLRTLPESEYRKLTEDTPQYHHLPKFLRVLKGSDQREDGKAVVLQVAMALVYPRGL
jgi:hypothetical protein